MQSPRNIVTAFAAVLIVGGCQKTDPNAGRMRYPGVAQLSKAKPGPLPETKRPEILPQTHFAAGMLFEEQGDVGKAIAQYRKAVALNHNYMAAYHRLGRMYSIAGKHDDAIQAVTRATEIKPDNAILHNDLSFEYMFVGRWEDAETSLRRAIALRPTMARAHINLALVQSKQGRFEEALATFREVLPEADAYYNLGLLYRGNRDYEKAANAFRHVLSIDEGFVVARAQLDELVAERKTDLRVEPDLAGPLLAQTLNTPAPRRATDVFADAEATRVGSAEESTRQASARSAPKTLTPAATPTMAHKDGAWAQGEDVLAEVVRSIVSQSAKVIRDSETPNQRARFARTTLPKIEELGGSKDRERKMLVESINAAIETYAGSSRRPVANPSNDDVVATRDQAERDEPALSMPSVALRPSVFEEIERLSYNTDEVFVEESATLAAATASLTVETARKTPPMEITRHANAEPELRYEDFLTDEEFLEMESAVIPSPPTATGERLSTSRAPTSNPRGAAGDSETGSRRSQQALGAPEITVVEASEPRIEWDQELVTLDELIDIMNNERRCFAETEFADLASGWPIVDSIAYSPVEFDAPQPDPWTDFQRLQDELDERAQQVAAMIRNVRSHDTESELRTFENSVASMTEQVARRQATAKRNTDARARQNPVAGAMASTTQPERRGDRPATTMPPGSTERTGESASTPVARSLKQTAAMDAPTMLSSPYGPPAGAALDRTVAERHAGDQPERRLSRARRTEVVHHGVEVDWRDEFRRIELIAAIVSNDLVCLGDETANGRDAVAAALDSGEGPPPAPTPVSRSIGSPPRSKSTGTRRR